MKGEKLLGYIGGLLILVALLLTVVDLCAFNKDFYRHEYEKDHQAEKIGMSDEGLMMATETLLDYLKDRRDDILCETEVNGTLREVYDERETLHMVDVKNLYKNALTARNIMVIAGIGIFAYLIYRDKANTIRTIRSSLIGGGSMMLILVGFIAVYAIADFYNFWMQFHYIFFDNDLFLLDPNTSIMINMFPQNFFADMVFLIMGIYVALIVVIFAVLYFLEKKYHQVSI